MAGEPAVPRDSATVLLLRDEPRGGVAVFMVKRHHKSGFMAGAYVFPGGTVDPTDLGWTRVRGRSPEAAAALLGEDDAARALALHVAAIRETFEEAGVLLAEASAHADLAAARARLHAGEDFAKIAAELELVLALDQLAPWSRWVTPLVEPRRYDARFFVARAPREQTAAHDRIEVTEGEWLTPEAALARFEAGSISLPPPTLRTIEQLAALASVDAAFEAAAARPAPAPVMPHFVQLGDQPTLTLPGDPEHPIGERRIEGPTRFVFADGRFRSA
ncbi:MAG: NUDIX hydrolase [Sandaracinaceae bacterium]|nr:NUDIX hydrolase [Sandaracinaceae bacterium]